MTHTLPEQETSIEVGHWDQDLAVDLNWHRNGNRLHVFFAHLAPDGSNLREDLIARVCRNAAATDISDIRFYEYQTSDARILWVRDVPLKPESGGQLPIQIRPATPSDRPRLIAIQAAAIAAQCRSHYTASQTNALLASKAVFRYAGERVFMAVVAEPPGGDVIVGFIALSKHGGVVQGLFVDPPYFRRGIGRQLLACVEAEALLTDRRRLWVTSALNAEAFYRAQGFTGAQSSSTVANGCSIPTIAMYKSLIPPNFPTRSTHDGAGRSQHLLLLGWFLFGWVAALILSMLGTTAPPLWVFATLLALGFWGRRVS